MSEGAGVGAKGLGRGPVRWEWYGSEIGWGLHQHQHQGLFNVQETARSADAVTAE